MKKDTLDIGKKKRLVPLLRFPEFEGEWETLKLVDVTEKIQDGTHFSPKINEVKDYKYLTSKNVRPGYLKLDTIDYVSEEEHRKIYKRCDVIYGDVLLTKDGASTGNACINNLKEEFSLLSSVAFLRANKLNASNEFIYQLISSSKGQKEIQRSISGQAITRITLTKIRNYKFAFPSLPEQKKIATFLSTIDKKIQQLTRKKELLETYKKGLMQQLFSGALRFRNEEGKAYPDWEEKRLGDVVKVYDGTHQTPKYVKQGIPFYSVEHLTANQFSKTKFISEEVFEKENKRVRLEKGDILMTRIGDIGTSRLIDWDVKASFYVSLALLKQDSSLYPPFLNQFISSKYFQVELWKRTIHVAFPKKINLGEIGKCKIQLPSMLEQENIADVLSTIDKKIEAITTKITKTKAFKKGLLQQLFV